MTSASVDGTGHRSSDRTEGISMITETPEPSERLLTPAEVAAVFGVDPKTVARWAQAGRLPYLRTLGGHRRYRQSDVDRLVATTEADRL